MLCVRQLRMGDFITQEKASNVSEDDTVNYFLESAIPSPGPSICFCDYGPAKQYRLRQALHHRTKRAHQDDWHQCFINRRIPQEDGQISHSATRKLKLLAKLESTKSKYVPFGAGPGRRKLLWRRCCLRTKYFLFYGGFKKTLDWFERSAALPILVWGWVWLFRFNRMVPF
jgi:hypothetical protein